MQKQNNLTFLVAQSVLCFIERIAEVEKITTQGHQNTPLMNYLPEFQNRFTRGVNLANHRAIVVNLSL